MPDALDPKHLTRLLNSPDYSYGIARCNLSHAGSTEAAAERLVAEGVAEWVPNDADVDNRAVDNLRLKYGA